ncbi:MAG: hydantoinase B/oxoprolinase family protein [Actinomycetota bacterium]
MPAKTSAKKAVSKKKVASKKPVKIDPITAEVIRGGLETIAFEMAVHVSRTATTPILNQSNERNATIMDWKGRLAALAVGIPQFMLSSMGPVQFAIDFFGGGSGASSLGPRYDGEGFKEGDVVACNDPYHGGGHLPDWSIFSPVFVDNELVLFASIQCHHADTAGQTPGGYPSDAMDIWAEGFRCPVVKLVDGGVERKDVVYLFKTNNRVPTYEGDLRAQIGAAQLGAKKCAELVRKFGVDTVKAAVEWLLAYSERSMREEIASWPDGVYEADSYFDHDVKGNTDVRVHARVEVKGDELEIDFAGSDDRSWLQAWSTQCNTRSMTYAQLCSMIDSTIPRNQGLFEPIKIIYPENTIVNPPVGKPVSMGTHHPGCEISEAVGMALANAIPEKVCPQVYKAAMPTVLFGLNPKNGKLFIDHSVDTQSTASAAAHGTDGWGCANAGFGNLIMATAEMNEAVFPSRHLSNDLTTDTGGAGKWRGAPGSMWIKESTADASLYTFVMSMKYTSVGVAGGKGGPPDRLAIRAPDGSEKLITHTAFYEPLSAGTRIEYQRGGGGGWGDPFERDPQKVRDDVLDEYISIESARTDYGVALKGKVEDYSLTVDEEKTKELRAGGSGGSRIAPRKKEVR